MRSIESQIDRTPPVKFFCALVGCVASITVVAVAYLFVVVVVSFSFSFSTHSVIFVFKNIICGQMVAVFRCCSLLWCRVAILLIPSTFGSIIFTACGCCNRNVFGIDRSNFPFHAVHCRRNHLVLIHLAALCFGIHTHRFDFSHRCNHDVCVSIHDMGDIFLRLSHVIIINWGENVTP